MGRKVLVGFDFPYGYPAGFCHALSLPSGPHEWLQIWNELANKVVDRPDNTNNRFAVASALNAIAGNSRSGPFWGCPVKTTFSSLQSCSPGFPFAAPNGISWNGFVWPNRGCEEHRKPGNCMEQAVLGVRR
jgi:hypothetical protein